MALFQFLKSWRTSSRIKDLEAQLRGRPAPQVYLKLADAYVAAGNQQKAAQILKLGVARFPSAPEISRRQAKAEKIERENEKRRLQDKIQTHPNPILYARLAELYKADSDIEKTIQICQAGIRAFPRYGGTYLVLGQIYAEKQQWDEAMKQLEKSVELDKYNYMALKLLSQVYMQMNRAEDAARRLEEILYFAPGDEAIQELLKKARETTGPQKSVGSDTTMVNAASSGLGKGVSAPGSQRRPKAAAKPAGSDKDRVLSEGISRIAAVDGVMGAILVDQYGLVVAADLGDFIDEGLAGALITNVYRTSSENADQLGVGSFEEGEIEGEHGRVHLVQIGDMIFAVFSSAEAKMGLLQRAIREFVTEALSLG